MVLLAKNRDALIGYNEYIKEIFKGKERKGRVYTDKTKVIVFNNKKKGRKEKWLEILGNERDRKSENL